MVDFLFEFGVGDFESLEVPLNSLQDFEALVGVVAVDEGEGLFGLGVEGAYRFH